MDLQLYSTDRKSKAAFVPQDPQRVSMYVCGPTVYNYIHIGNARPAVVFDVLFRVLRAIYGEEQVVYARNITDIDDKIMKTARENGESIAELSARYTQAYNEDLQALHCLPASVAPKATEYVDDMISMISTLVEKGHAYESEGEVLFAVQSMENYGCLSHRDLEDMLAGARVEVSAKKRYDGDFVLWKPSSEDEPGWDSPWGRGRPGWHTECCAMIESIFASSIDIHGGGVDLVFPHHENEQAQGLCAHGRDSYARVWMHNGFLNIDGEKMAKSLGNFKTVNDLRQQYKGEVLRFALLSAHYRSELDFSKDLLEQAKASLDSLYGALQGCPQDGAAVDLNDAALSNYLAALADDLNTPIAIGELHGLARSIHTSVGQEKTALQLRLRAAAGLLGLLQSSPEDWFQAAAGANDISAEAIEALIAERIAAKQNKDYARADEIREQLKQQGIALLDTREGTDWRRE